MGAFTLLHWRLVSATRAHDVWPAVAVEIRERQPTHGALAVIPTDFVKIVRGPPFIVCPQ
jgi:hypothetical protein